MVCISADQKQPGLMPSKSVVGSLSLAWRVKAREVVARPFVKVSAKRAQYCSTGLQDD